MAESKRPVNGEIATAELQNRKDTGYSNWNITLKNGDEYKGLSVPPDGPKDLKKGMKVTMWPGKFTKKDSTFGYNLAVEKADEDSDTDESTAETKSSSSKSGKTSGSGKSYQSKEGYWDEKSDYEKNVRDPKIERQRYIEFSVSMFVAALPFLEEPPKTVEEVEEYLDAANTKGCALFDTNSKL